MCVHPELNKYIRDVLVGTKTLIRKGAMDKVVLAINDKVRHVIVYSCVDLAPNLYIQLQKSISG